MGKMLIVWCSALLSASVHAQGLSLVDTLVETEDVTGLYHAQSIVTDSSGNQLYVGSSEGRLVLMTLVDAGTELQYDATVDLDDAQNSVDRIDYLAISADDRHLYATGPRTQVIAVVNLSETGASVSSYFEYAEPVAFFSIGDIALTPDGNHLYAAANIDGLGQIVVTARDTSTGDLSLVETVETLDPYSIVATDQHVYVGTEHSLDVFTRNPATGTLTFLETHTNTDEYSTVHAGPAATADVALSADGRNVYSITFADELLVFTRDAETGRLTLLESFDARFPPLSFHTLGGPRDLVVSNQGDRVYVNNSGLLWLGIDVLRDLAMFERDLSTGQLAYRGSVYEGALSRDIALSPDGSQLFAVGTTDDDDGGASVFQEEPFSELTQLASAMLPTVRTGTTGMDLSVFATVLNAGGTTAFDCDVDLPRGLPDSLKMTVYTTDAGTNEITDQPFTFDIPAGGGQTLALFFSSSEVLSLTEVAPAFYCLNADFPTPVTGVNTVFLAARAEPVADIVAIAGTPVVPGVIETTAEGASAFVVATYNNGATSTLRALATSDLATVIPGLPPQEAVPVALKICETDPITSICKADPADEVEVPMANATTSTFGLFVAGQSEIVPFDPANSRIHVVFIDEQNIVRGGTSVAVAVTQ